MNCDDAFDALTDPLRWSDPLAGKGAELQEHLARCPRCRQMEETLSPALQLFEAESQSEAFRPSGPMSGSGVEAMAPRSVRSARRDAGRRASGSSENANRSRSRVLAVAIACVLLLGIASNWISPTAVNVPPDRSTALTDCFWLHPESARSAGRATSSASVVSACVACHLSGGATAARVQMLACVQCHAQSSGVELDALPPNQPSWQALQKVHKGVDSCAWVRTSG